MNLEYYYWYFKSAIPSKICDEIIKYGLEQQDQLALTGKFKSDEDLSEEQLKDLSKKRKSNVVWMNDNWIYKEIHPYIRQANVNAGWNFDWDFSESCQFTKYKEGEFYDWHCDSWNKPYDLPDDKNRHGKIRKLSVTVCLSDETEYEGGDFEFDFRNQDDGSNQPQICTEIRPKGSVVVFPSFLWHRVNPVTSGTRHSLVIWNLGRPFR
jgi:PKHD-type hydroxylase